MKQETQSLACALRILFRLHADETRADRRTEVHNKLIRYTVHRARVALLTSLSL